MLTADEILPIADSLKGLVMIIGEPDTGKSYLAHELFRRARSSGKQVSLLDLDVGQQSLAYPGTISFTRDEKCETLAYERMRFVGAVNPILRMDEVISEAKGLLSFCIGSHLTVVDTSGLVEGEKGKVLKTRKVRALMPDLIIAIQKSNELEHILCEVRDFPTLRVLPSPSSRVKTRDVRVKNRMQKLLSYFSQGCNHYSLRLRSLRLRPHMTNYPSGRIIGLNSNGDTIGLGLLETVDRERISFVSPIPEELVNRISEIVIGDRGLELYIQTC